MQKLSRRRGVVSVFLLIIFMVTYVFMGLLVDAARYRMAGAYAEAALDQAGDSVLSNYNRLVFDLYGLFAVETKAEDQEAMETKIKELFNHYLEETLGIANVTAKEYETVLNTIFAGIKGEEAPDSTTKQLYDFEIADICCGTTVTLADTANVESQIIEYMKFRAPVDLIQGMSGFLKKIKALLEVKDLVADAIEKTEIVKKYESGGEDSLSQKAYALQYDINKYAVKLYNYSVNPTWEVSSFGAADPGQMFDRNAVYGRNPYSLKILIQEFDEKLHKATDKYEDNLQNMENKYAEKLFELLNLFRTDLKEDHGEIIVTNNYKKEDDNGQTNNFTEIDFYREELTVTVTITLAEDLYQVLCEMEEEERTEYEDNYIEKYKEEKANYESGGLREEIENELRGAYKTAHSELVTDFENIEANASGLYEEAQSLRDRLDNVIRQYDSYIGELQAKLDEGGENKKTVYAPEIELAKGNAGELLKNLDLLLNSRLYLNRIGYGDSGERLSHYISRVADDVISKREDYYISNKEPAPEEKRNIYLSQKPLEGMVGLGTQFYKDGIASKDLYLNPYTEAVGDLLLQQQGDLCTLYSHASYFQTCHYKKDVDVNTGKRLSENKVNTDSAADKVGKEEGDDTGKKKLDNEDMLKDADYLKYLTVNYQYSAYPENPDTELEVSVNGKADLNTMLNILKVGEQLIAKLEELLKGARDNLYIDVYVMSMLPNYYDYLQINAGKEAGDVSAAFQKEYEEYNASYASVEYVITGAGARKGQVFGNGVKAGSDGDAGTGFGELSVRDMRARLFGTRMLFNCISMFADSAKYYQASSLSAWAGPFAPLVTIVLMVAWAAAESVLDVLVLLGEGVGPKLDKDGQVALLKQGKDWFFSIEGAVSTVVGEVIDGVAEGAKNKVEDLTKTLETKLNGMIYDTYSKAQGTVSQTLNAIKGTWVDGIKEWTEEVDGNISNAEILNGAAVDGNGQEWQQLQNGLSEAKQAVKQVTSEAGQIFDKAQQGVDQALMQGKEYVVTAVGRASEEIIEKANSAIDKAGKTAGKFLADNLNKVIPTGEVVNSGRAKVKMGYKDYLYFYLFFMDNGMKVKRIQSVLQANMWVGGHKEFLMETSPVSVWADLECTIKYFFLSNGLVPEKMRRDGRLRLKVISGQTY